MQRSEEFVFALVAIMSAFATFIAGCLTIITCVYLTH